MDTRSSFSSICMLWISVCVGLHSGESVFSVSGYLGSTAVLPCELKSVGPEPHIRWSTKSEIVFERQGESFSQGDGYEDRVDVPEEELRKGNCSLVLRNLQLTDKNVYTCSYEVRVYKRDTHVIPEFKEICSVSLSVRGLHSGESVISVSGDLGSTAVLNCNLRNADAETYIRWSTDSEIVFERQGESFSQGEGYKDRVDVPVEELRKGNCSLVLRNLQLTDRNVYTCSYKVRVYKRDTHFNTEFKEICRVSLSVSEKPPEEKSDEVSSPTGDAGITRPHPLISITALISCFLILLF